MEPTKQEKLKNILEIISNIAVLLVALVFLGAVAVNFYQQRHSHAAPVKEMAAVQKGDQLASVKGVDFAASPHTLLVAMSTGCGYCRDDAPFYNALAAAKPGVRIIGVFPNKDGDVKRYVQDNRLAFTTVSEADFRALHLAYTPMAVLVDARGIVLDVWGGKLSTDGENHIRAALGLAGTAQP